MLYRLLFSFSSVFPLVLSLSLPASRTVKIPLPSQPSLDSRSASKDNQWNNVTEALEFALNKYRTTSRILPRGHDDSAAAGKTLTNVTSEHHQRRTPSPKPKAALGVQDAPGRPEAYYWCKIDVNQNQKPLTVVLDTGSSTLVVPGPKCGASEGCGNEEHPKYTNSGKDMQISSQVFYGGGHQELDGDFYQDDISLAGLVAKDVDIFSVTKAVGSDLLAINIGILGFGFPSGKTRSSKPSVFQKLVDQNKVDQPVFSYYLGRMASGTLEKSSVVLGGVDPDLYRGPMAWTDVLPTGYWQTTIVATVQHCTIDPGWPTTAIIDSGTSYIIAPPAVASILWYNVKGAFPVSYSTPKAADEKWYVYPCDVDPEIALVFGDKEFKINPLDLSIGEISSKGELLDSEGDSRGQFFDVPGASKNSIANMEAGVKYCLSVFVGGDLGPSHKNTWLVGTPFLRNYMTTFDMDAKQRRIGFAAAVGNNDEEPEDYEDQCLYEEKGTVETS